MSQRALFVHPSLHVIKGQRWLPLAVLTLCAGAAHAAIDPEAPVQLSRQQSQLAQLQAQARAMESWRLSLRQQSVVLQTRYDSLHEVQRELDNRFMALRDRRDSLDSKWKTFRASHQQLAFRVADVLAQAQTLSEGEQPRIWLAQAESQTGGRGMIQLLNQVETLNAELNKLRGKVEELGHGIASAEKRQRDMYLDLDTRMRRLEQAMAANLKREQEAIGALEERLRKLEQSQQSAIPPPVNTAAGSDAPAPAVVSASNPAPAASEGAQRAYETALSSYRTGDYQGAINGFVGFLQQYPQHPLAANAQYWIGDAYFQLRDYKAALEAQRRLIAAYPDSPKVPDAMLNMGSAELGLGDLAAARKSWEELVAKHPSSEAADKARQRLARLR
ncbi:MAG TPA: tol-pal system protein YbgF [Burkholderiales bacterium]|nr:tol-pal system protein YbgF [Burkholderiales bacterium]